MINLKLAEYNLETGKFERFLEIGKGFGYFGDYIGVCGFATDNNGVDCFDLSYAERENFYDYEAMMLCFFKDEKDSLNRFEGRFHGRTYGEGRFVLEVNDCDSISCYYDEKGNKKIVWDARNWPGLKYLGNLHQNPELWEKIK